MMRLMLLRESFCSASWYGTPSALIKKTTSLQCGVFGLLKSASAEAGLAAGLVLPFWRLWSGEDGS